MTGTQGQDPSGLERIDNPFRPGAGHAPPHLAGRAEEFELLRSLLEQRVILKNLVLTGVRGIGKTVLLDCFKRLAVSEGWLWAAADLSESASSSEETLARRLLTDLSVATSSIPVAQRSGSGFHSQKQYSTFNHLSKIYEKNPGLTTDRLRSVFESLWPHIESSGYKGLVFAYDEAHNLSNHPARNHHPMSVLLDTFQSIQRTESRYLLILAGLPSLFPSILGARAFAERMFGVRVLESLTRDSTTEAVLKPVAGYALASQLNENWAHTVWVLTHGYPYYVQYLCREAFDVCAQAKQVGQLADIPVQDIVRKLDADFFAGRWGRLSNQHRELLRVIVSSSELAANFTVRQVVDSRLNRSLDKPFTTSQATHIFESLSRDALLWKDVHDRYSLPDPLLRGFIERQFMQVSPDWLEVIARDNVLARVTEE